MMKPNTSEGVKSSPLIAHQELDDEIPKVPIPKVSLPIKMVLGEDPHVSDQATTDTSLGMTIWSYLMMSMLGSSMSS